MKNIKEALRNVMVKTGRISPKDRITIGNTITNGTDWVRVEIYAYHGRQKKPFVYWNLCVNMARNQVYWDKSTFYYI